MFPPVVVRLAPISILFVLVKVASPLTVTLVPGPDVKLPVARSFTGPTMVKLPTELNVLNDVLPVVFNCV